MPHIRSFNRFDLISLALLGLSVSSANAATYVLAGVFGSELQGAKGVTVNGLIYDVEFLDGTCIEIYSGCDDVSDFSFNTEMEADAASQALLEQVFSNGDIYDDRPELTRGISGVVGQLYTPYLIFFSPGATLISSDGVQNAPSTQYLDENICGLGHCSLFKGSDFATFDQSAYVRWSPVSAVPIPVCDVQLNQLTFIDGDTATADVFRIANLTAASQAVEWKVWLGVPGFSPISIFNLGADGSLVLPAGFDADLGPLPLVPVTASLPRGNYELSCRMLDPVTGSLLWEDLNNFEIQ